jgi:hypothetical protein
MANGSFGSGDGTVNNPYLVEDWADLNAVRNINVAAHFKQTKDIDMNNSPYMTGAGFVPIITSGATYFTGVYDGNYKKIYNLYINRTVQYTGLFGRVSGEVKNLGLVNVNIASIQDSTGGICGSLDTSSGKIINCFSEGFLNGTSSCGLLVGTAGISSSIDRCYSSGNVSTTSAQSGGLVGNLNGGIVANSCSLANVISTSSSAGGLVGIVGNNGNISNCFARGSVEGSSTVGGLVGRFASSMVNKCYSTGKVTSTGTKGGLIGYVDAGGSGTNGFWDTQTSQMTTSAGGAGVVGKTTAQMKDRQTFLDAGWVI